MVAGDAFQSIWISRKPICFAESENKKQMANDLGKYIIDIKGMKLPGDSGGF